MSDTKYDVLGIGNAIVDVLAQVDDAFLEAEGLAKGGMALIDAERAAALSGIIDTQRELSGGSVANTMVGLADLGGRAAFIGKVGTDRLGETFRSELTKTGVAFLTPDAQSGPPTAQCVVLVTPDAQRTMNTFLGCPGDLPGRLSVGPATRERSLFKGGSAGPRSRSPGGAQPLRCVLRESASRIFPAIRKGQR